MSFNVLARRWMPTKTRRTLHQSAQANRSRQRWPPHPAFIWSRTTLQIHFHIRKQMVINPLPTNSHYLWTWTLSYAFMSQLALSPLGLNYCKVDKQSSFFARILILCSRHRTNMSTTTYVLMCAFAPHKHISWDNISGLADSFNQCSFYLLQKALLMELA